MGLKSHYCMCPPYVHICGKFHAYSVRNMCVFTCGFVRPLSIYLNA